MFFMIVLSIIVFGTLRAIAATLQPMVRVLRSAAARADTFCHVPQRLAFLQDPDLVEMPQVLFILRRERVGLFVLEAYARGAHLRRGVVAVHEEYI